MYTTFADIQARFPNTTLDQDLVDTYIAEAKAWIDEYTQTSFGTNTASTRIYSTRILSNTIIIDYAYEVEAVEFLVSRVNGTDTWSLADPNTYRITPENTTPKTAIEFTDSLGLNYPIYFEGGNANIRVRAKWGYKSTVPAEIKRIATQYVINAMRQDDIVDAPIRSERLQDTSITYELGKSFYDVTSLEKQLAKYKDYGDIRL